MLTTQGITVRDPETGAMFVQTQLLQVCTAPSPSPDRWRWGCWRWCGKLLSFYLSSLEILQICSNVTFKNLTGTFHYWSLPHDCVLFVSYCFLPQDDPPISSLFTEQVDDNATLLLHNDLSLLPDISQYVSDTEHVISTTLPASVPPSTETTINLQDLA